MTISCSTAACAGAIPLATFTTDRSSVSSLRFSPINSYRAFSRALVERLPLEENSDDFLFDNQMLAQIHWVGCTIAEITCPTKYFPEASSINFRRSVKYGLGCIGTGVAFRLAAAGLRASRLYPKEARGSVRGGEFDERRSSKSATAHQR